MLLYQALSFSNEGPLPSFNLLRLELLILAGLPYTLLSLVEMTMSHMTNPGMVPYLYRSSLGPSQTHVERCQVLKASGLWTVLNRLTI